MRALPIAHPIGGRWAGQDGMAACPYLFRSCPSGRELVLWRKIAEIRDVWRGKNDRDDAEAISVAAIGRTCQACR